MAKLEDLKSLSILYADDDEVLAVSTCKTLSMLFDKVYTAKSGLEAINIYNTSQVHIIMLDIKMVGMSGIEVANTIRKDNKSIPIFLVSSYTETKDLLDACKLNLIEYLQKPFTFQRLSNTLIECVEAIEQSGQILKKLNENMYYNQLSKEIIKDGEVISLTNNEISIFELLLDKRGQVIPYNIFQSHFFDDFSDSAIKNIILRLRKKIGDDIIRNLSKVGYILV